jgi:hypothetical protein
MSPARLISTLLISGVKFPTAVTTRSPKITTEAALT